MPEGRAHSQELPQPKGGRAGSSSLDESRPVGRTPDEGRGLFRMQEGRPHHRPMLEGAPGADSGGHTEKKGKCVRQHLRRCAMLRKKHIHTLNETLNKRLMNIERVKVHELVEAL